MKAIICAAGKGSRLKKNLPKCLIEVGGKKIIDWQLEALQDFEITVVCGYKSDKVLNYLKNKNCQIIINNEYELTSTAHSVSLCDFSEKCLILDGDLIFLKEDIRNISFENDWAAVTDAKSFMPVYVKIDEENNIIEFNSEKSNYEWACMCYTYPNYFINKKNKFVYEVLENFKINKAVYIDLFEIDTPEDLIGYCQWDKINFMKK